MKLCVNLGTFNAGGETARTIDMAVDACRALKHGRVETNEGANGTWHTVSCSECGYAYQYDSGD